jgi:hypothetical protein
MLETESMSEMEIQYLRAINLEHFELCNKILAHARAIGDGALAIIQAYYLDRAIALGEQHLVKTPEIVEPKFVFTPDEPQTNAERNQRFEDAFRAEYEKFIRKLVALSEKSPALFDVLDEHLLTVGKMAGLPADPAPHEIEDDVVYSLTAAGKQAVAMMLQADADNGVGDVFAKPKTLA